MIQLQSMEWLIQNILNVEYIILNNVQSISVRGYYYVDKIEIKKEHFTVNSTSNSPTPNPATPNPAIPNLATPNPATSNPATSNPATSNPATPNLATSTSQSTQPPITSHSINTKEFKYGVCLENKCVCPNGNPTTGINCHENNQLSCKKDSICNQGYYKYYESEGDRVSNIYKCVSQNECIMEREVDRNSKINDLNYPDYLFTLDEINNWKEANPTNSSKRSNQNHEYSPNFIRNNIECLNKKRDNSS